MSGTLITQFKRRYSEGPVICADLQLPTDQFSLTVRVRQVDRPSLPGRAGFRLHRAQRTNVV